MVFFFLAKFQPSLSVENFTLISCVRSTTRETQVKLRLTNRIIILFELLEFETNIITKNKIQLKKCTFYNHHPKIFSSYKCFDEYCDSKLRNLVLWVNTCVVFTFFILLKRNRNSFRFAD